jgi:hypothetical protein
MISKRLSSVPGFVSALLAGVFGITAPAADAGVETCIETGAAVDLAGQRPTEDAADGAPAAQMIEKLGASKYRIGMVTLEQKTREIRFPAKVNMNRGLIEYLLCQQRGKVHETLFVTEISPTHLGAAFALLRYPASNELFPVTDEAGHPTGLYPKVNQAVKDGARIAIEVEWTNDGKSRRLAVNGWIQHTVKSTAMKPGPWLYTGGDFSQSKFVPEQTGDLAAIMAVPGAMIHFPGPDNDDKSWQVRSDHVPPVGTPVTIIISPYSTRPVSKP